MEPVADPLALLVLAGGEGRRLGAPKAWLDWGGRPLLLEVLDRLAPLADAIPWVSGRPGQELPAGAYRRVDDLLPDGGPLAGLAVGLAAVARNAPGARVAVAACDYPFADPRLFRALAAAAPEVALVLPRWGGHLHPLQALWSARLAGACSAALAAGERRVGVVVEAAGAAIVDAEHLAGVPQPERALLNLNDAGTLARARALAGAAP